MFPAGDFVRQSLDMKPYISLQHDPVTASNRHASLYIEQHNNILKDVYAKDASDHRLDIAHVVSGIQEIDDRIKLSFIQNRKPEEGFIFPVQVCKDKRIKEGFYHRHCRPEWLDQYDFSIFSKQDGGLYCLSCTLFPNHTLPGRPRLFVSSPYKSWNNAVCLQVHAAMEYHKSTYAEMVFFLSRMKSIKLFDV